MRGALTPSTGKVIRTSAEWSIAGELRYVRGTAQYQYFYPLTKKVTLALNAELGFGAGTDGIEYPIFKNFYSGGLGSVRGFDQGTLGPRDVTGSSIGGPKKITLNAEVIAPFPGAGNDRTLRIFAFTDVGNVFGEDQKLRASDLRASVGVGLSWISPIGPLRIAFANPLRKQAGDRIQKLQFQIGTSF